VVGDVDVDPDEAARVRTALDRCPGPVDLAGVVDPPELSRRYAAARVLLTASRYEGRPIAVTEAMASGVPVCGFDVAGVRELVRHNTDGLLARDGDADDLAASLRDLASDPDLATAMGHAARGRAMRWPTWKESAARFAEAIASIRAEGQETVAR
jgi:glycosyltransferase involved in cell wall biosynthesis